MPLSLVLFIRTSKHLKSYLATCIELIYHEIINTMAHLDSNFLSYFDQLDTATCDYYVH